MKSLVFQVPDSDGPDAGKHFFETDKYQLISCFLFKDYIINPDYTFMKNKLQPSAVEYGREYLLR